MVAVDDLARVRGWYEDALGRPGQPIVRGELGGRGVRFTVGPHTLEFLGPQDPASPLQIWLAARGASPYEATLRTAAGHPGALDPTRTLGARISFVTEDAQ